MLENGEREMRVDFQVGAAVCNEEVEDGWRRKLDSTTYLFPLSSYIQAGEIAPVLNNHLASCLLSHTAQIELKYVHPLGEA